MSIHKFYSHLNEPFELDFKGIIAISVLSGIPVAAAAAFDSFPLLAVVFVAAVFAEATLLCLFRELKQRKHTHQHE